MTWEAYTLTYQAQSPVSLGAYRFGFIQRTRYYAPGWTLWGAITAQLTRAALSRATGDDYETMGRFVAANLPTSYAYVLVDGEPAWPHYDEQGQLCYGPLTAAEFESRFVASYGQTAVAPGTLTAHTGTLHETEMLSARDHLSGEPVHWQVTLYVCQPWQTPFPPQVGGDRGGAAFPPTVGGDREGAAFPPRVGGDRGGAEWEPTVPEVLDSLKILTLGADRGYGFGRLRQVKKEVPKEAGDGPWPRPLDWDGSRTLRAHLPLGALPGRRVRGRAEPISRRLWQNDPAEGPWGPGQRREVHLLYAPGSRVKEPGWQPAVGPLGIWLGY